MPFVHRSPNTDAALAVLRLSHHLSAVGLAMLGGEELKPDETRLALQILTSLGKAEMKGLYGLTAPDEAHEFANVDDQAKQVEKSEETPDPSAKYRIPGNKAGHFNEAGKAKIDELLDLNWTDYSIAKALGINDNALRQRRAIRKMVQGTVKPTPEEVALRLK